MTFRSPAPSAPALTGVALTLAASHLAWVAAAGRLRWEHVAADVLLAGAALAGPRLRPFLRGGLAWWLTGVLLDSQRLWLHLRGTVHTGDLWALEARLFPAPDGQPWPAWFATRTTTALDVLCGLGYATYLAEFFLLALALLALGGRERFSRMSWAFFLCNLVGTVIYLAYPAAPPWYVLQHGPGPADLAALPSAAGAARFDALFGIDFFHGFYSRNPNVFGAMPSLHAAYPLVALWMVWHRGAAWRVGAALFALLIAFSAVYLVHHYVLDVLAGWAVALATCAALDARALLARRAAARLPPPVGAPAPSGETHA